MNEKYWYCLQCGHKMKTPNICQKDLYFGLELCTECEGGDLIESTTKEYSMIGVFCDNCHWQGFHAELKKEDTSLICPECKEWWIPGWRDETSIVCPACDCGIIQEFISVDCGEFFQCTNGCESPYWESIFEMEPKSPILECPF